MDVSTILSVVGVIVAVATPVVIVAVSYGRLTSRMDRLEKSQDEIRREIIRIQDQLWDLSISRGE